MATSVRDWSTVDYYELLGVPADATNDDIARAFRTAAKQSHPDTTSDPGAAERFKDLAAAYTVLSDRRTRRDYDRVRTRTGVPAVTHPAPVRPASPGTTPAPTRWTRRRAWIALVGGIAITVAGLGVAWLTWSFRDTDAQQRARFVPVAAARLNDGNIQFSTVDGARVVVPEPRQHGEGTESGPTVDVRYDPDDPQHVIVDASTFGRDITLAIVALKLLVGGPVFAVLGARQLRRRSRLTVAR